MHLVFENSPSKPYYQNSKLVDEFSVIIKELDKWSVLKDEDDVPDDCCNGIIASVYKFYKKAKFPSELIVRPIEMFAYYDNDTEKLKCLEKLYRKLIDFIDTHIIPEMKALNLMEKEDVRHLNYMTGQLTEIKSLELQLVNLKGIKELENSTRILNEVESTSCSKSVYKVNTNIPKLFLLNNYNRLHPNGPNFFETKNIVVSSNIIARDNEKLFSTYKTILLKYKNLTIFINSTNELNLNNLIINKDSHRFIFLTLDIDSQEGINVNYNWDDLNERSQKSLLRNKIIFQNKKTSWNNLLKKNAKELSEVINTKFLNILLENSEISINTKHENQVDAKIDELLYKPRGFIKKDKNGIGVQRFDIESEPLKAPYKNLTEINEIMFKLKQNIQNKFLQVIKDKRHVLISDMAGNGKSQFMKEIAKVVQYEIPRRWVSFVELKEFIEMFNEEMKQNVKFEFSSFMAEKVLKFKYDDIEFIIFKFFYNNGRVFIIFDGFDEIASRTSENVPNCDKFVLKLAQKFQQNNGNQLCITTRDYFEATLVKELQLDTIYSLDNISESDGTRFIVRYWMLMNVKHFVDVKSMVDYLEEMFESTVNGYMPVAKELVKKVSILNNRSIGLPLLFNMIAVIFKDKFDTAIELKISKIFEKFAKKYYNRWAHEKGLLGIEASTESVAYELNYWKFLQFCAILNLFPDYLIIFFPDNDRSEWSMEAIIACGLIKIINENYYFSHESFCDYFASDALAKYLKKTKIDEKILKLFAEILTDMKYQSIRMFLNDLIENYSMLSKIVPKMSNYMDLFYNMDIIEELFENGLDRLSDFVIELLNEGDCIKVKKILFDVTGGIIIKAVNPDMFTNYKELLFKKLETSELENLIINQDLLHKILESSLKIEIFEEFVKKIRPECAKQILKRKHWGGNIFFSLCGVKGKSTTLDKVRKFITILKTFFPNDEIFKLMKYCGFCMPNGYYNILQVCVEAQTEETLRIIWIEIKNFFESPNLPQNFKEFVTEKYALNRNILHLLAKCNKVEFHDCLWEFLYELFPNSFENREELKNIILEKSKVGCNFIHDLFNLHKNIKVIKYTLNNLELNFNEFQFHEILTLTDYKGMNLLQSAALDLKNLDFFEFLWKIYEKSFKTNENFVKFLNQFDNSSNNLIMNIISGSTNEIFNFTMLKLKEIKTSREDIRKMMSHCGIYNRNLLQLAAFCQKVDLHNSLWEVLDMYFESSEILNFITNIDTKGEHFLFDLVCNNTIELVKLTWSNVKHLMDHVNYDKVKFLNIKNLDSQNLAEIYNRYKENPEICEWVNDLFNEYNIEYDNTCYITENDDVDLFDYDDVDFPDDF